MPTPLLFQRLFERLKKELGYSVPIEKYKAFVAAFAAGQIPVYDYERFLRVCRMLFLQKESDRAAFDRIINGVLDHEVDELRARLDVQRPAEPATPISEPLQPPPTAPGPGGGPATQGEKKSGSTETPAGPTTGAEEKTTRYLHLNAIAGFTDHDGAIEREPAPGRPPAFLHTDEYFPITRRQMIKTWHFLRREDKTGKSSELDLPGTVRHIARNGMFLEPVYLPGVQNQAKTLVIFADSQGSMAPFHAFTQRLIETALGEGGLPDTAVYYFRNFPVKYVYRKPELLGPVRLEQALAHANPNFTVAMVISDAGAARGNYLRERVDAIVGKNTPGAPPGFLQRLQQHFVYTVWLNPMPRDRWEGTSAQPVARALGQAMHPVFSDQQFDFHYVISSMMNRKSLTR